MQPSPLTSVSLCYTPVSATPEGRRTCLDTIGAIRSSIGIALTVGGGVKSGEDARKLLEAGADKVAVNSAAVKEPELLARLAAQFGRQCIVIAIDARRKVVESGSTTWEVMVNSGKVAVPDSDAVAWAKKAVELGAGEVLLTSFDRDGTKEG